MDSGSINLGSNPSPAASSDHGTLAFMEMSKQYSIVCYLEGALHDKVRAIQGELFELTGSRKCLDAWTPHITLGSGVIVPQERQREIEDAFAKIVEQQSMFDVVLIGFGGTTEWKGAREGVTTPYVLWVNPVMNEKLLELFNTIADKITSNYDTFYPRIVEYVPHVTVAYGDLSKEGYEKGDEYLKTIDFKDVIIVSHIALVENFPDKDVEYKRFYFRNQ